MTKISISPGNSKMGSIASVSLPAGVTCNPNAPCYQKCYARRLSARRKTVSNAYERNLTLWDEDPASFELQVKAAAITQRFFRFHVSGDIVDENYLEMIVRIATEIPTCHFMAFTKQYELVNAYLDKNGSLPENLQIIFSVWRGFDCPNPYSLPEAHVLFRDGFTTAREDAIPCGGNCTECCVAGVGCWNLHKDEQILIKEH